MLMWVAAFENLTVINHYLKWVMNKMKSYTSIYSTGSDLPPGNSGAQEHTATTISVEKITAGVGKKDLLTTVDLVTETV